MFGSFTIDHYCGKICLAYLFLVKKTCWCEKTITSRLENILLVCLSQKDQIAH